MYTARDLIDAVLEYAEQTPDEKYVRRLPLDKVIVAWERLTLGRVVSVNAIRAGLRTAGFEVYEDADGVPQLHRFEERDEQLRTTLIGVALGITDSLRKLYTYQADVVRRACNRPTLIPKDELLALVAAMDDAVDLFQAGRYNWRPIACERLVAAVNSIPAVYTEKYNYQKEKDALKASLTGGHRHQVDSDSQKI